jgi:hypothetical protein
MAGLDHASNGHVWTAIDPPARREYVVSLCLVINKINVQGRVIDGDKLSDLVDGFYQKGNLDELVIDVMARFIREHQVG